MRVIRRFTADIDPSAVPESGLVALPFALTALRALLAPAMVSLAVVWPSHPAFGACLVAAFLSDVFDGVIARRLGIATANLRRFDSIADTLFYAGASFAAWHLEPQALLDHRTALVLLVLLEISRYAFDLIKFKREASYHMWSSKLWGLALFVGFFSLLALGRSGWAVTAAIWLGLVADIEGLAISAVLTRWTNDVPSIAHAIRLRKAVQT
ncbi:MAG: CDP-alcohol phosphatidyltransferase family protein [Burkholderiaceae bacterium]